MQLTILGSGTSCGVPTIGCKCEVCTSNDPHDCRLRCSAIIETETTRVLIDCGPDFRQQMLGLEFKKIDAVLLTHIHYDHVGGIDDLRPFCVFGDIDIFADSKTAKCLRNSIPYCFAKNKYPGVPKIKLKTAHLHKMITVGDINIMPIRVMHGKMPILGFRINDFAYITDMKTIRKSEMHYLDGVKTMVVNALRHKEHPTHQTIEDAIAFINKVGSERNYLIHMSHDAGLHEVENALLPKGVSLAYDGLKVLI